MLFLNTKPKVENDYSNNFDFHIVRAGTRGVFQSALIKKKKKKKRIGHNLVPTYKIFVAFSLCASQNKLKAKGYEEQRQISKNNIRVALCQKTAGKKSHIPKMAQILIGGKNGHFVKAIAK